MSSIKTIWDSFKAIDTEPTKGNVKPVTRKVQDDFKLRMQKNLPSELVDELKDLNRNINDSGKSLEEQGYRDGSIGVEQNENIKGRIKAITGHLLAPVKAMAIGICDGLSREIESLKQEIARKEEHQKLRRESYDLISNEYNMNSTQFSLLLGVFYCLVAFFLILADIPLAVELTKKGFDLKGITGDPYSEMPFLAYNPLKVIRSNWEVFVLAIGIALSTIYFKIYYDYLIGKSTYREVLFDKHLNKSFSFSLEDWERVHKARTIKARVSFTLLILTILTMLVLGYFRFEAIENQMIRDFRVMEEQLRALGQDTRGMNLTYEPMSWVTKLAFVLVTVLFPLIGGVCASIGLKMIHRYFGRKSSLLNLKLGDWSLQRLRKRKNGKDVKLSSWSSHLMRFLNREEHENWNNDAKREGRSEVRLKINSDHSQSKAEEEVYDYLYSSYLNGVNEGLYNPQSQIGDEDFFAKVVELRDRHKSKKYNKSLRHDKSA